MESRIFPQRSNHGYDGLAWFVLESSGVYPPAQIGPVPMTALSSDTRRLHVTRPQDLDAMENLPHSAPPSQRPAQSHPGFFGALETGVRTHVESFLSRKTPSLALPYQAMRGCEISVLVLSAHAPLALPPDILGVRDRSTLSPALGTLPRSGLGCVHDVCVS
jgi:hypothetical protein